jgi:hypothetical protein
MNVRILKNACGAVLLAVLAACGNAGQDSQAGAPRQLASVSSVVQAAPAAAALFEVTGLQKTGETRVSRTVYDYIYQVSIRNNGSGPATNVQATLATVPKGVTIIQGLVNAGSIGAGATVTPKDLVVLRIDRTIPFDPAALSWTFASSAVQELDPVKPAEVVELSLADLGLPDGADKVSVTGAVTDVLLKGGTLRFSTPGDTGAPQHAEFTLVKNGVPSTFALTILTDRPAAPLVYLDATEDGGAGPALPALAVGGLGPNNSFAGNPLTFKLQGAAPLDLAQDSDGLVLGQNNVRISLKPYWTFNPADNSFTISGAKLQQLMAVLPRGALDVSLNFVSADGEFAAVYQMLATGPGATLSGRLVTPQGGAVTGLAGKKMLLRGFNQRLREVTEVDANGNFTFTGVIPDTYQLTLNDLENPNVVSASTIVLQNATSASVTIVYNLGAAKTLAVGAVAPAASFVASSVKQDGTPVPARSVPSSGRAAAAAAVAPYAVTADGGTVFSATAAAQNATITTPISFTVPKGTQNVGVKITVFTQEYPVWTTQQSQYNDTWSYSVTGLPGTGLSASGSVNQSHYTQGTITKTACVDVSDQAKNAPFTVGGQVSATNIGDSQLPTTTTVELTTACIGLKVTDAKFKSPNKDGHPVLQPLNTQGNLAGPYLSVPLNGTDGTHTLPLEIKYSPADAKISEVNISVSSNGTPVFASENLMGQAHTDANGVIKFSGIRLPAFPGANTTGKVTVTVRVKGTVQGTEVTSDPQEGGQVALGGETAFTPLYLANDEAGLGARRYGTRDAGGDSWATRQTITWLQARAYRFDDTSGQHVTQTSTGRSILGHSGHSDGQQIDMRYADGQGGYSETLGGAGTGAGILALINAARQEVTTNAAQKPKLAALQAWIAANRANMETEAAAATTRHIYVGPSFIKLALIDGKFSGAPALAIPDVQAWSKPAVVQVAADHLHHWHLSTTAHP